MTIDQIRRHSFFRPVVLALFLHFLIIAAAMAIRFSGPVEVPEEEKMRFNVKQVDVKPVLLRNTSSATNPDSISSGLRFFKREAPDAALLPKDVPVEALVKKTSVSPRNSTDIAPKHMDLGDSDGDGDSKLEAILVKAEEKQFRDKVQVQPKSTSGFSDVLHMVEKHRTDAQELLQALRKPLEKMSHLSENVNIDPEEGMPGFTPVEGTLGSSEMDQGVQESKNEVLKYESLDDFLDIQVFTYQDPRDRSNYFMIKIFAKPSARQLAAMPKEILFTIDCSLSISPERLDEFKRGISACLKDLNKEDVFNIVAFRDKALFFSERSIGATDETIRQAEQFVSALTSNRTTDVYGAFEKIVKTAPARRPSNIILISDGRPTHGVVNSRELINSVTRLNDKKRPVFAYSGGAKVNRYLLDFIAYQNRGWSQFIKDRGRIHKGLVDFYSKIKDPIFLNLRYELNNLDREEVFPKSLPDFYRNAEFTVYGKYEEEDEFSMQLLGDAGGKTKELIFSRSLKKAPAGGPDIMKGYAFNKVYHLISRMTAEGQSDALKTQIEQLSRRYGVTTPYSLELEAVD